MEYEMDIFTFFGLGVFFIALFLGLFFLFQKKFKNDGYLFLYISILILGCELFYKTLIHSRLMYDLYIFYHPGRFYNLLIYPIFLFFVWYVIKPEFKLKTSHKFILLASIIYSLYVLTTGLLIPSNEKLGMLNAFYSDTRPGPFNYWLNLKSLLKSTIIPLLFLGIIGYDFLKFKRKNMTSRSKRLMHILSAIIVVYFLFSQFSNLIYKWFYRTTKFSMIEWPIDITFLSILIVSLSVIALLVNTGSVFLPPTKYIGSSLEGSSYDLIINRAKDYVENNELYKKNKLTITELSKQLDTNPKYLSQAINHRLNLGFVDFINNYRVEEAKKQMLNVENSHLTLETIGLMAGFKSKSAFFRAFKKVTNSTPNQFLKSKTSTNS
ncbi:helix-turn-helix domain-containing protein [Maribellus maritimus]|uniref:helix-turn-helix domain-containing protein n=1 Tax=Maribellus maritimus TaxID=2870838 RepID=UPI001EEAAFEF|nr:helix-turn-helix domain-containing protein [Maribellus maritimus]MCG6191164.1 helix-turn-helix domain-containing protein [Maribellus maritimus]